MAFRRPLEVKTFERLNPTTGLTEEFPSLDKVWCADVNYLPYIAPSFLPGTPNTNGEPPGKLNLDPLWIELVEILDSDFHQLLQLEHHKFWSQVMHDQSLHKSLDSYLRYSPRPSDQVVPLPLLIQDLLRNIHRKVFMIFLRMSTHKESSDNFISPEFFGKIVYDYYIFDIPKLMDICTLYGTSNQPLVTKMVSNIFDKQPRYMEDWKMTVKIILETLQEVSKKVLMEEAMFGRKETKLGKSSGLSPSEYLKIIKYIGDFVGTLCHFVSIFSPASTELVAAGFVEKVVDFYGSTVTSLQKNWHSLKQRLTDQRYVKERLRSLKRDIAWLVHQLLEVCFISPKDTSGVTGKGSLDGFIAITVEIASERSFLREYMKQFNLAEDVQTVQTIHPEIPQTHIDYILSAMMEEESLLPPPIAASLLTLAETAPSLSEGDKVDILESLVCQVKEILPHLGDGFIEICLKELGNDPERVISGVLEDNLPLHLKDLDFSMMSKKQAVPDSSRGQGTTVKTTESLVDQRECVFDNDEFDVFRKPEEIDLSRVQIGKKYDTTSTASLLDDKSHLERTRERYKAYEIETPWDYISEEQAGVIENLEEEEQLDVLVAMAPQVWGSFDKLYDDEYDDTYDSHNVGASDDATDELFAVKRLNQKGKIGKHVSDDEEQERNRSHHDIYNDRSEAKEFVRNYFSTSYSPSEQNKISVYEKQKGKRQRRNPMVRTIRDDSKAWKDEGMSWRDDSISWRDNGKSWRDDRKARRDDSRAWRDDSRAWRDDGKAWRDDGSARRDGGKAWRDDGSADSKAWRDDGSVDSKAWRDGGSAWRDDKKAWRDDSSARRDDGRAWRDDGRAWRDDDRKAWRDDGRDYRVADDRMTERYKDKTRESNSLIQDNRTSPRDTKLRRNEHTGISGDIHGSLPEESSKPHFVLQRARDTGEHNVHRNGLRSPPHEKQSGGGAAKQGGGGTPKQSEGGATKQGGGGTPKQGGDGTPKQSGGGATKQGGGGTPKQSGGGAAKQSARARQVKDRNKGGQANHNRKAMADKKRRGGMI